MIINKSRVLAVLRDRGQHTRADWVDRQLPDRIDTDYNAGILATLNLDPRELADLVDAPPSADADATVVNPGSVADS